MSRAKLSGAALAGVLALTAVVGAALAQSSILHEFIPPDPGEDVTFAATTLDGDLPAAIQTPSGMATSPDPKRAPDPEHAYGGAADSSPDSTYEPDRDTRRPNVESYDDPFSPATAPFKRMRAYDSVGPDYALHVRDHTLTPILVGGRESPGDEPFYGDYTVDLAPDTPVRVPTVGPGARLLKMHTVPDVALVILRDGADNWFVRASVRERVRVVVQLAIPRATFGSELADVTWSELDRRARIDPPPHPAAFADVARAIGVSRAESPREAVTKLVEYFRSFAPSDDPPRSRDDIYLDLALSRKGVCRHRSFAFLVTALHLGIPARMVVNEAHAWVEVFDGTLWHRVDLGGAAQNLENEDDPSSPPYVPPPDPYAWPADRDSGQELADRSREKDASPSNDPASPSPSGSAAPAPPPPSSPLAPAPQGSTSTIDRPPAKVTIVALDKDIRRGVPLHLQGEVSAAGTPCAHARVDAVLVSRSAPDGVRLGSLSTDDRGAYDGAVVIPRDVSLGEYDLVVVTPGNAQCGWGKSE